jgi:hypothetical protein
MEVHLLKNKNNLKTKLPDIEKTLSMVEFLKERQVCTLPQFILFECRAEICATRKVESNRRLISIFAITFMRKQTSRTEIPSACGLG